MKTNTFKDNLTKVFNQSKDYAIAQYEAFTEPGRSIKRKKKLKHILTLSFTYFFLLGLCFVILFPTIQQILQALRAPQDLNDPSVIWIPKTFSTLNLTISMRVLNYWKALFNTFRIATVSMILQLFSTALAGYAFARLKFRGSNLLFIFVIITIVIPPQALGLTRYLYFRSFGLIGSEYSRFSLYMMNGLGMGIRSGIFIFIFRQFFAGLPKELEESAQIDGAGVIRTFFQVMLPNARGALVTVALFSFVWAWNDSYFVGLFKIATEKFPLLTMQLLNAAENTQAVYARLSYTGIVAELGQDIWKNPMFLSAISNVSALLIMLPLLIGYLFVQKSFVESIERTGIVG